MNTIGHMLRLSIVVLNILAAGLARVNGFNAGALLCAIIAIAWILIDWACSKEEDYDDF